MDPRELVQLVKKSKPEIFKNITESEAAVVVQELLKEIHHHLDTINEGVIKVPKLGKFIIRQVERENDGKATTVKKISFIRAKIENKKNKDNQSSSL